MIGKIKDIRLLLLAALSAFMLASCSQEEMGGGQGTQSGEIRFEIGFAPQSDAMQTNADTRVATDTEFRSTWEEGDEIGVFAVEHGKALAASDNLIHNVKLTYTGGEWKAEEDIYWPKDGTKLDFYAYHPYDDNLNPTLMAFSVYADQSESTDAKSNYNLSDLLTAKTTKADGYGKGETVPLSFTHALAMVQVNVSKSMVGDYAPDVLNVWLNGCTTDGVLNLSTQTVTRPLNPASPEKIKMYPCPNDGGVPGTYAYRALVPAQEIAQGTALFSFEYGGNTLLRSEPLAEPLSLVAGTAETFDMTFPFTSATVSATKRLAGLFTDTEFAAITHLKVMGEMTEEDFNTIKSKMTAITNLDLGGATVTGDVTVTYGGDKEKGNAIPCDALSDKRSLKKFIFPRNITVIGVGAFYDCNGLTGTLTIPAGVTTIGGDAFFGCSGFTALSLPESLTTIEGGAFYNCTGFTGPLSLPESLTMIEGDAFNNCSGFTGTLTIPGSVETIRSNTFMSSGFSTVFISSGVTSIESIAFNNCQNLTTLTIPASVVEIESSAFDACFAIKFITCHITDLSNTAFDTDLFHLVYNVAFVYVPAEAITDYKSHLMWGQFKSIQAIPEP